MAGRLGCFAAMRWLLFFFFALFQIAVFGQKSKPKAKSAQNRFGLIYDISVPALSKNSRTDFLSISQGGFSLVQLSGPFWSRVEPSDGKYDLQLLDNFIEQAASQNLKVVVRIPLFQPPSWFAEKYPDSFSSGPDGQHRQTITGSPVSVFHAGYKEKCENLIEALANRYGKDNRIQGWIIDFQISHVSQEMDNGNATRMAYIQWLERKYEKIEILNEAWSADGDGCFFQSFQKIWIPHLREQGSGYFPKSFVDWKQFGAVSTNQFLKNLAEKLKLKVDKEQWISSEFLPWNMSDLPHLAEGINFPSVSFSAYMSQKVGFGSEGFRVGDPFSWGFPLDYFRMKGRSFGISQVDLGRGFKTRNQPLPKPGFVKSLVYRLWSSEARPVFFEPEKLGALSFSQNLVQSTINQELIQTIREIMGLPGFSDENFVFESENSKSLKTGILYRKENYWDLFTHKISDQWNTGFYLARFYELLKNIQVPMELVEEDDDFSGYRFLVLPAYSIVSKELSEKLLRFVEKGGNLIITCRFSERDENGKPWFGAKENPLQRLLGIETRRIDMLPKGKFGKVTFEGKTYDWSNWGEVITVDKSCQTPGIYADQFYKNTPAVIWKNVGKGSVLYLGVETDAFSLEKEVVKYAFQKASGKNLIELPSGLEIYAAPGLKVAINFHSSETRKVPISPNAKIFFGNQELKPCEVLVWSDQIKH